MNVEITQELRARIAEKDRENVRRKALEKLKAGKPMSARERAIVAGADTEKGYAQTLDELGEACGVDQRTIQLARKRFAKDAPRKRQDGRYPIAEYKEWLSKHGVVGRRGDADLADEREIKLDLLKLSLERQRFEFERIRDRMLPAAQFEAALAKTLSAFLAALNAFGPRVNESLEGLDYNDRALVIEKEVELLRRTLATCDYLNVFDAEGDDSDLG